MSSHEQAVVSLLSNLALSFDGAVLGLAIACAAFRSILGFTSNAAVLRKLRDAPSVGVSDLRSILWPDDSTESSGSGDYTSMSEPTEGRVVIVRGTVEAKSAVDESWKSLKPNILTSQETGGEAVVIQRTQTVPFILTEGGRLPLSDSVFVNMDSSKHPLPLTTVYHQLQTINASPYTFLQGHFLVMNTLTEMSKDQMIVSLALRTTVLFWSGVTLGSLSIGILGFSLIRNWNRWKQWRWQRRDQEQAHRAAAAEDADTRAASEDDESGNVPDGQLCVICLMRRRRSVFIPCGHLICCQHCALSVEREISPKCPVCRQSIYNSMRIYAS